MPWTRDSFRQLIADRLQGTRLIVVSNRAPYCNDGEWQPSVGGVAAALEPVMRVCGGTWIARGDPSGGEVPRSSHYAFRSVTLQPAIAAGFYSGFANGALW